MNIKDYLSYDAKTGKITWIEKPHKKNKMKVGDVAGCLRKDGYFVVRFNGKLYFCHRLAWYLHYGIWPKEQIDHIDGNPSNNSITNLREVNNQQNSLNKFKAYSNNKTGVLGVGFYRDKFIARIKFNNKSHYLGIFDTKEQAALAYCSAKKLLSGTSL